MTRSDHKWSFSGFVVFSPSTMKCWLWVRVEPALWMVREQGRSHYTLKFTCKNTAGRPRTRALVWQVREVLKEHFTDQFVMVSQCIMVEFLHLQISTSHLPLTNLRSIRMSGHNLRNLTRLSIFSWNGAWDGWSNWNFEAVRETWIWFIVINRYTSPPSHVGPCHRDWKSLNTVLEQLDFNVLNSWVDLGPTYVHEGGASRTDFMLYRNLHTDQKSKQVKYLHHHPMHQNSGCRHVPMIATLASRSVPQHSRSPFHWRRHLKQTAENTFVRTRHCGINRLRCLNVHPWSAYDGLRTMKILIDVSMVALNFPNSLQIAPRYRFPGRCSDSFFITRLWRKNCRVGVSKPTSKLGFTAAWDLYFENRWTMLWGTPRSGGNGTSWTRPRRPLQHMTWDPSFRS